MAQIKITQIKSRINAPKNQKLTLDALGIRKMNHSVVKEDSVIEINRKGVKDHLETGRHIVIEPGVTGILLPCIDGRRKITAATVIKVTKGFRQLLQQRTFLSLIHARNLADYFFSAEMSKEHADQSKHQ